MARNIVFTDLGGAVKAEETQGTTSVVFYFVKTVSQLVRTGDVFKIHTLGGQIPMGEFLNSDLATPEASANALEGVLAGFFTDGWRVIEGEMTPTDLTTLFSGGGGGGIELLAAGYAGMITAFQLDLTNLADGSDVYAGGDRLQLYIGGNLHAEGNSALLTEIGGPYLDNVTMINSAFTFPLAGQQFQKARDGAQVILKTNGDTDFTIGNVADGSTIAWKFAYKLKVV